MKNFTGSNPNGYKAEIQTAPDGFSVFTWRDNGSGVILWREKHNLSWATAFTIATDWIKS